MGVIVGRSESRSSEITLKNVTIKNLAVRGPLDLRWKRGFDLEALPWARYKDMARTGQQVPDSNHAAFLQLVRLGELEEYRHLVLRNSDAHLVMHA